MAPKAKAKASETTQLVEIQHEGIDSHGFVTPTSFKKLWEGKGWKLTDAKAAEAALETVPEGTTPIESADTTTTKGR